MATIQKTRTGHQVTIKRPTLVTLTTNNVKLYRKNGTVRIIVELDEEEKKKIASVETSLTRIAGSLAQRGISCEYKSMISCSDDGDDSVFLFVPKAEHAKISSSAISEVKLEVSFNGITVKDGKAYPSYFTKYVISNNAVEELELELE